MFVFKQTTGGSQPAPRLGRFVEAKSSISSEFDVLPAPGPESFRRRFGTVSELFRNRFEAMASPFLIDVNEDRTADVADPPPF